MEIGEASKYLRHGEFHLSGWTGVNRQGSPWHVPTRLRTAGLPVREEWLSCQTRVRNARQRTGTADAHRSASVAGAGIASTLAYASVEKIEPSRTVSFTIATTATANAMTRPSQFAAQERKLN